MGEPGDMEIFELDGPVIQSTMHKGNQPARHVCRWGDRTVPELLYDVSTERFVSRVGEEMFSGGGLMGGGE